MAVRDYLTAFKGQVQGVQKVTQPMSYLESVSWTLHFKATVASTITGLKPPQTYFSGGISRILCIQIIHTHTARASGQHIAHWGQDINGHVFANMIRRVHLCEEHNGGHFQNLL
jgi:hypothetical protein